MLKNFIFLDLSKIVKIRLFDFISLSVNGKYLTWRN